MARPASSLYLNKDEYESLQELAAFCGYLTKRGKINLPNVSALNRALANLPREKWPELKNLLDYEPQ